MSDNFLGSDMAESEEIEASLELLSSHSVLSLATLHEGRPHAASLMYANQGFVLFWVSDPKTRHCRALADDARATVTVAGQYEDFTQIRGLQMAGVAARVDDAEESEHALALLAERYAFFRHFRKGPRLLRTRLAAATVYRFQAETVTLIDNTQGFGYKRTFAPPG